MNATRFDAIVIGQARRVRRWPCGRGTQAGASRSSSESARGYLRQRRVHAVLAVKGFFDLRVLSPMVESSLTHQQAIDVSTLALGAGDDSPR